MTMLMHKKVKITVLWMEYYKKLAEQYVIPNRGGVASGTPCRPLRPVTEADKIDLSTVSLKKAGMI